MKFRDIRRKLRKNKIAKTLYYPIMMTRGWLLGRLDPVYIISFPKSGRTWVRFFLSSYFTRCYGTPLLIDHLVFFKAHPNVPRFHFDHTVFYNETLENVRAHIKKLRGRRVILIVRDPRDVVTSFYFHTQKRQAFLDSRGMEMSDFIRHPQLGVKRTVDFMNLWIEYADQFSEFTVIRYKDLKKDSNKYFSLILEKLGIRDIDRSSFDKALLDSSFENMKKLERLGKIDSGKFQTPNATDDDSYKVRKGKVGGYREYFSGDDLEYLNSVVACLDPSFGYQTSSETKIK